MLCSNWALTGTDLEDAAPSLLELEWKLIWNGVGEVTGGSA